MGSAGSALSGDFNNATLCVGELSNGNLVVGGSFSAVDGVPCSGLARHDGATWSAFGSFGIAFPAPFPQLNAVARTGNGDLLAGGFFSYMTSVPGNTAGIARWNGSSWQPWQRRRDALALGEGPHRQSAPLLFRDQRSPLRFCRLRHAGRSWRRSRTFPDGSTGRLRSAVHHRIAQCPHPMKLGGDHTTEACP